MLKAKKEEKYKIVNIIWDPSFISKMFNQRDNQNYVNQDQNIHSYIMIKMLKHMP